MRRRAQEKTPGVQQAAGIKIINFKFEAFF